MRTGLRINKNPACGILAPQTRRDSDIFLCVCVRIKSCSTKEILPAAAFFKTLTF